MEELQLLLEQYAIIPIALICCGIGYVIKHYVKGISNRLIPVILGVIGLVLNIAFNNWAFTIEIAIKGFASGLVATGGFEAIRNIAQKKQPKEEVEVIEEIKE